MAARRLNWTIKLRLLEQAHIIYQRKDDTNNLIHLYCQNSTFCFRSHVFFCASVYQKPRPPNTRDVTGNLTFTQCQKMASLPAHAAKKPVKSLAYLRHPNTGSKWRYNSNRHRSSQPRCKGSTLPVFASITSENFRFDYIVFFCNRDLLRKLPS